MCKRSIIILNIFLFLASVFCISAKGVFVNAFQSQDLMEEVKLPQEFSKIISLSIDSMLLNDGFRYKIFRSKKEKQYIWLYENDNTKHTDVSELTSVGIAPQVMRFVISLPIGYVRVASDKKYFSLNTVIADTIKKTFITISKRYKNFDKFADSPNALHLTYNYDLHIQFQNNNYMVLLQKIVLSDDSNFVVKYEPLVYDKFVKKNASLDSFFSQKQDFNLFSKDILIPYIKNVLSDRYYKSVIDIKNADVGERIDDVLTDGSEFSLKSYEESEIGADGQKNKELERIKKQKIEEELNLLKDDTVLKFGLDMDKKEITAIIFYFDQGEAGNVFRGVQQVRYPVRCEKNRIQKFQCREN